MVEWIEAILVVEAILLNCFLLTIYGLSGKFKDHLDLIFKKKKEKGVNSGAKFG